MLSAVFSRLSAKIVSSGSPTDTLYVVALAADTLPTITMKFEPAYLIIYLLVPGAYAYVGGHSYEINKEKRVLANAVKPYFSTTTGDELLAKLYKRHQFNRAVWYGATSAGIMVMTVGFLQRLSVAPILPLPLPIYDSRNNNYVVWSVGLAVAGIAARIVCFRQLRKAVNYYNVEYAGRKPTMSLHVGLPSTTPGGLALYLRF